MKINKFYVMLSQMSLLIHESAIFCLFWGKQMSVDWAFVK